jgi:serine/threonine protein kinase
MRWDRKSLWMTVARGSHFSRCGDLCLLTIPRSNVPPQMPPHIHIVYQPSEPSKKLIAKKVIRKKKSNELEILKRLNAVQPKSEHVISLLDSFHGQSGSWMILPRLGCVADYIATAPEQLESKVIQVCWGLIKGLAHLHQLCIAHRDIKPDNLVLDQDFYLKIIDFDLAMQLKDEDEEVDDECGTEDWVAPEVEKTSTMYSPIRADRWSCGRVLLYLLDESKKDDEQLRVIGRELKVHNPDQRPSLLTWRWPIERKASRPRQDSIEINERDSKQRRLRSTRMTGEAVPHPSTISKGRLRCLCQYLITL